MGNEAQGNSYLRGINYAPYGGVNRLQYGNGLIETRTYDANRLQLTGQVITGLMNFTYQYDAEQDPPCGVGRYIGNNGNVYKIVDGARALTYNFCYDALNRLKTAQVTGQPLQNYFYDQYGNMRKNNPVAGFINPLTNRIAVAPYSYDEPGNLLNDGSHSYTYDSENRVTQIDSGLTKYRYNGQDRRVEKETGGVWTFYIYDQSGNLISEYEALIGSLVSTELVCAGSVQSKYYHVDHLGTPRLATDQSGNEIIGTRADYMPYGEEVTATLNNRPKFASYYRDAETGLDHTWFRKYSPALGRWMSPDIVSGNIADPQSLNRYSYVQNGPMNFTDPAGLFPRRGSSLTPGGPNLDPIDESMFNVDYYVDGLRVSSSFGRSLLARASRGILPSITDYAQKQATQVQVEEVSTISFGNDINDLIQVAIARSLRMASLSEGKDLGLSLLPLGQSYFEQQLSLIRASSQERLPKSDYADRMIAQFAGISILAGMTGGLGLYYGPGIYGAVSSAIPYVYSIHAALNSGVPLKALIRIGYQTYGNEKVFRIAIGGPGSSLPFHLHIHKHNLFRPSLWDRPWSTFKK